MKNPHGNPNHPSTQAMDGEWHKIVGLILEKYHPGETLEFTMADIRALDIQAKSVCIKDNVESRTLTLWLADNG